jgi:phosphopantetheinyl transferase (holo-ACP synthase)
MVGNDIVDLRDPDSDSTSYRNRFDERVFSRSERKSIYRAPAPERQRWRLWAAKEASYKIARRRSISTVFSPRAFAVDCKEDSQTHRVEVAHEGTSYFVAFDETAERIHAIAVTAPEDFARVLSGIDTIHSNGRASTSEDESSAVRNLACDSISRHFGFSRDRLEIRKSPSRIPRLYHGEDHLDLCVSLSHHGSFRAFACCRGEN